MSKNYIVRHSKDVPNFMVENCQGGTGSIFVRQLLGFDNNLVVPGFKEDLGVFNYVHITTLPKGAQVGQHFHTGNQEFYLVIKGKGEMVIDGDSYEVESGSIGLVKNGSCHSMKNVGEDELQMVVVEVSLKENKALGQ